MDEAREREREEVGIMEGRVGGAKEGGVGREVDLLPVGLIRH